MPPGCPFSCPLPRPPSTSHSQPPYPCRACRRRPAPSRPTRTPHACGHLQSDALLPEHGSSPTSASVSFPLRKELQPQHRCTSFPCADNIPRARSSPPPPNPPPTDADSHPDDIPSQPNTTTVQLPNVSPLTLVSARDLGLLSGAASATPCVSSLTDMTPPVAKAVTTLNSAIDPTLATRGPVGLVCAQRGPVACTPHDTLH
jgi:hypothetical protein